MRPVACLLAGLLFSSASLVRADTEVVSALDLHGRFSTDGRHGASVSADVWWPVGPLHLGLTMGIGAARAGGGETSAVFTPVGGTVAYFLFGDTQGPFATLRAGAGLGAEKGGFFVGPFGSLALGYAWPLGETARLRLGAEGLGIWADGRRDLWFGPVAGLGF